MQQGTCVWPKCYRDRWSDRGIPICQEHARLVGHMFTDTDSLDKARAELSELRMEIWRLQANREPLPAPKPKRAATPTHGFVYYVQIGAHIKIGWTSNMQSRMRSYPPNSQLLAAHPGTRKDEQQMHRRFAADRTHGREWYVPSVSLTHHIAQMVERHGKHDVVDFGAKPLAVKRISTSAPIGARSTRWGRAI